MGLQNRLLFTPRFRIGRIVRPAILSTILLIAFLILAPAVKAEKLVLNTGAIPPLHYENQTGFLDVVYKEAFGRLGIEVILLNTPAERAIHNADAGIDDGDASRIAGLEKLYPNLISVPEKVMDWNFVAFGKDKEIPIAGWDSFGQYSVGIITGWKIYEHNVTKFKMLTKAKEGSQLFMLLEHDRTEIILFEQWQGLGLIRQHGLHKIKLLQPPLARKAMYLYLHKNIKKLYRKSQQFFEI